MIGVPNASDGFDMGSATTMFWESVPIFLRSPDRAKVSEQQYIVRVFMGQKSDDRRTPVLRIYIFDDTDPQFLQTMDVNEEDFQALKSEQGILVDFPTFAGKVLDLLRQCITAQTDGSCRFRAELISAFTHDTDTQLRLVEINDFKQIAHITLSFHGGSDRDVKAFLGFRLNEQKRERDSLSIQLASKCDELREASEEVLAQRQQLKSVEASHKRMVMEASADAKDVKVAAHHELVKQREELICVHERYFFFTVSSSVVCKLQCCTCGAAFHDFKYFSTVIFQGEESLTTGIPGRAAYSQQAKNRNGGTTPRSAGFQAPA